MIQRSIKPLCAVLDEPAIPETREKASGAIGSKLALIIPTLYEAGNIAALLGSVQLVLDSICVDYEILIVDDDSRDGTAEIVRAIAAHDPRIRLLVRKGPRGLSGAILHGWEHTDAPIVGVMDADFQHPPELLPKLVAAVFSGCDLAVGSRYIADGRLGQWNPLRKLASAVAVLITGPIQRLGLRASDPMSGFFLVRRDCLRGIPFQQSGFKLLLDILARARISSVREIPFTFGQRRRGRSKANLRVALEYCRLLARLYWDKFRLRRVIPSALPTD
jgi:dolichol-phosphate mannosyltransferase